MREIAINVLKKMIENAGKDGVTEGQAVHELVANHDVGYWDALDLLRSVYKEAGAERTPEHTGELIRYRKSTQKPDRPESKAEILARQSARRAYNEYKAEQILNYYKRNSGR